MGPGSSHLHGLHGLQPTNWRPLAVGAPQQTHTVQGPHSAPCAPEHKAYASLISMSGRKRVGGVWGTHTWRNTTILGTAQPSAPSPEWGFEKYEEPGRVCLPLRVPPGEHPLGRHWSQHRCSLHGVAIPPPCGPHRGTWTSPMGASTWPVNDAERQWSTCVSRSQLQLSRSQQYHRKRARVPHCGPSPFV